MSISRACDLYADGQDANTVNKTDRGYDRRKGRRGSLGGDEASKEKEATRGRSRWSEVEKKRMMMMLMMMMRMMNVISEICEMPIATCAQP